MKKPDSFLCLAKPGCERAAWSIVCEGKQEFYELDRAQVLKIIETAAGALRVMEEGKEG